MKVLMVGPDRGVHGGISGVVNNYYNAGLDKKVELCYIGTMVEGSKVRKLLKAAGALVQFLVKLPKYEIVHVNVASDSSYYRKAFFIRLAKLFHKKIVIHQHGGDFQTFYEKELSDKGRKSVKKILSMGDAFLVLAPAWKEFFGTIIEKEKITVLPNAVQIPKTEEVTEKEYGCHKILFLGRICRTKGIGELLTVMPALKEKYPNCMLYLGGIWEDAKLKELAEQHKECVTYIGWITGEEKKKYLEMCDVFVLPSYFEGQPVSVLEAMAYSLGIAASDIEGISQMLKDGEDGILFPPKDAQALQNGLERLLSDASFCKRQGAAAREKAIKEFSIEKNIEQLLSVYQKVLQI